MKEFIKNIGSRKAIKSLICVILMGTVIFSLAGCNYSYETEDSFETEEITESIESEIVETTEVSSAAKQSIASSYSESDNKTTADNDTEAVFSVEKFTYNPLSEQGDKIFTTDYYTVTFPKAIKDLYKTELEETQDAYNLYVYDKQSNDAGMGGLVFSICLYENKEDYKNTPAYNLIGKLTIDEKDTYYVLMVYPTDVQYADNTEESWRKIYDCRDDVRESFKANSSMKAVLNRTSNDDNSYDNNSDNEQSKIVICNVCKGAGHCMYCTYGECFMCNGSGKETCKSCIGLGRCGQCGGDGYYYSGVGISFGKYTCRSCSGTGRCSLCSGTGKQNCSVCRGTARCSYCNGDYICDYCNGRGYIE